MRFAVLQLFLDPGDVEEHPAVRAAPALPDLPDDAAGDVVAGQQFGRPPRFLVSLGVAPALFRIARRRVLVGVGDVVEHEPAPLAVPQDAAFAAHSLGHQDAPDARRPHHPGRVELDVLHVDELRPGLVGERVAVTGVFPTVGGDPERPPDPAGGEHHRRRPEELEAPLLAVVAEGADHPAAIGDQPGDRPLHVDVDAEMDPVVLEGADHLQPGPVPDVREPRVLVAAEVALEDFLVGGAVEHRPPGLQFPDPVRRFLGVELGHRRVVDVLAAPHGVREVGLPVVAAVHVAEGGGDPALRHHGVRLAEQRLGDEAHAGARRRRLDGRAESGAPGADDQDVVFRYLHQRILKSVQTPMEQSRT